MSQQTSATGVPATTPATVPAGTNLFGGGATSTATAGAGTNAPFNPSSAFSPYTSQAVETGLTTQVGAQLGAVLGLTPGPHTVGEILQHYEDLSSGELRQLQVMLEQGGFYVDQVGDPLPSPTYGSRDAQSFDAMINAAMTAGQSRMSLDQVIQNNITQGVGANLRSNLPQPVTGGGNFYTIDLANPEDVRAAAYTIFQQYLGRNPTDAEISTATSAINSAALAQGYARDTAHEGLSRTQYQTGLNQRNTGYQFQTTPKLAAGPIPNGPINNPVQYAVTLLQYMNQGASAGQGIPVTASNVAFIAGIINATGNGLAGKNPLGTMLALPGATPSQTGQPPTYASWAQSIQATAESLMSGPYANTLAALASGDASGQATSQNVQQELSKWSNGQFSNVSSQAQAAQKQAATAVQGLPVAPGTTFPSGPYNPNAQAGGSGPSGTYAPGAVGPPPPQAGGAGPNGTYAPGGALPPSLAAASASVNPADVNPGQQVTNPTDTYVNPVTSITTPAPSPQGQLITEATTGANRPAFLGNEYLQAYQAILSMIKAGGPTSG